MIADRDAQARTHVEDGKEGPVKQRIAIELAEERCTDQRDGNDETKERERLIGKRGGSNSVRHSHSF